MKTVGALLVAIGFLAVGNVSAQDMKAKKYENPEWYQVVYVDYLPGKEDDARKLIDDYFKKASDNAGTPKPVMEFALYSGEYDYMYIWKLDEGLQSLDWEVSPNQVEWGKAFMEMAGGKEKAEQISDEYSGYVNSVKVELARKDN